MDISKLDKELIEYCKSRKLPISEMGEENFKLVEKSAEYNSYKLGVVINNFKKEILEKINHRKNSCKKFKKK